MTGLDWDALIVGLFDGGGIGTVSGALFGRRKDAVSETIDNVKEEK